MNGWQKAGMGVIMTGFLMLGIGLGQVSKQVDAIDVEPVVRFASNDAELEEQLKLYEDLLIGLLVCEAAQ